MPDRFAVLCNNTIAQPTRLGIGVPAYPRVGLVPGVVHLGLGAFSRAHQALVFDDLLASGDTRWGVFGVATRSWRLADALAAQDGLYAIKIASDTGTSWRVVGSVLQVCAATREPNAVYDAIAHPATRWITVTVTEKGYNQSLAELVRVGLRQRWRAGLGGLTLASCDNLRHNGDILRALCVNTDADKAFSGWVKRSCSFPNSMVDRIVPAATASGLEEARTVLGVNDSAALFTESFWQWVVEDNFAQPDDALALSRAGVTVVADVKPYEDAKLGMLNGSHSALACISALMGLPTVCAGMSHVPARQFLYRLMSIEVMPHLSRPDLPAYRDALLQRFANPTIIHDVHQIASDSSKKIGLRWVPAILAQLSSGGTVDHHAFAAAAWMRYCLGRSDGGQPYRIADPQEALMRHIAHRHRFDVNATVEAFMQVESIWSQTLQHNALWMSAVKTWLRQISSTGTARALEILVARKVAD